MPFYVENVCRIVSLFAPNSTVPSYGDTLGLYIRIRAVSRRLDDKEPVLFRVTGAKFDTLF